MNLHYFKEQHALELPPFGASHIDLGELVWKEPFRRPNWLDNGLPKNIFNCFLHFDLLDEEQRKKQQKKIRAKHGFFFPKWAYVVLFRRGLNVQKQLRLSQHSPTVCIA